MQVSEEQEKMLAQISLNQIIQQYQIQILPSSHPVSRYVNRVTQKIISAIQRNQETATLVPPGTKWRVFVIDAPIANAFVLPGGEIFVFTGILSIASTEDGLAAVIGHEIAHKLVRHVAEKVSFHQFIGIATAILQIIITGDAHMPFGEAIKNLLIYLPFSRKCETEADYIGLLLMAQACFDPAEAVQVWRRMEAQEKGLKPPAFMSTHPGHRDRIGQMEQWLPEARRRYEENGCCNMDGFPSFFKL